MIFQSVNPSTEEPFGTYPVHAESETDTILKALSDGQRDWKTTPVAKRADALNRLATIIEADSDAAILMTREMGKPIAESEAELKKCAHACRYFAMHADTLLVDRHYQTDATRSFLRYSSVGTVLAIMPWNFPFWQTIRCAVPTLLLGNAVVLKHAENVPACAERTEHWFHEAGFSNVFSNLRVETDRIESIIAHRTIRGVALTGSVGAGRAVAALAGRHLKPLVLELGGSDPFIVFADADIEKAVAGAAFSRFLNSGQSCIAAKRLIVHDEIFDAFHEQLGRIVAGLTVGDPLERNVVLGPMARQDLKRTIAHQVARSDAQVQSYAMIPDTGFFYPPTIAVDPSPTDVLLVEETFGPVAVLVRASSNDELLSIASNTTFGLGASIWTTTVALDPLIDRLDVGHVAVNGIVKSDVRLPFGGTKTSGIGRELSDLGTYAFANAKTVSIM